MRKILLMCTIMCLSFTTMAQIKVQGVPRSDIKTAAKVIKKASNEDTFTFDDIKNWSGEGSNECAFVLQFNTPADEETAMVFGYRWDGDSKAADMLDAILKNNPRLYYVVQGGTAYGSIVGGFGWDIDDDGVIGVMLNGVAVEGNDYGIFNGSSSNYDSYTALDEDDWWASGWYSGYWSLWQKSSSTANWGYASTGVSGMNCVNGGYIGFSFAVGMNPQAWKPLASAPALIPEDAETQIIYNNVCYTLTSWGTTKKVEVAAPFEGSGITYSGAITIPATFTYKENEYTVTGVADHAFANSAVSSVTLPDAVKKIGAEAFAGCSALASINVPASLTKIDTGVFKGTALTSISLHSGITTVGESAFEECESLTSVTFAEGLTTIGDNAFAGTGLTAVSFPSSLTSIGQVAFAMSMSLSSVTFAEGLITIGDGAFSYTMLTTLDLPSSLTSIGVSAFEGAPLEAITSLTIYPATCGVGAFDETTTASATLTVPYGYVDLYKTKDVWKDFVNFVEQTMPVHQGDLFTKEGGYYKVTAIGDNNEIIVTHYGEKSTISSENKAGYTGDITIPSTVNYQGIDFKVVAVGDSAFMQATELTSVVLPETITEFGTRAFYNCSKLASVNIPSGVTKFNGYTFYNCKLLASDIVIPEGTTTMGGNEFYSCEKMPSITLPSTLTTVGTYFLSYCKALNSITVPASLTSLPNYFAANCTSLTSLVLPETLTTLGNNVFANCSALTSVVLPESVKTLGTYTFQNCASLTSATLPSAITEIPNYTFSGCTKLASFTIPAGVTKIGNSAFTKCPLAQITIPAGVTSVGNNAFESCTKLTSIEFPDAVTTLGTAVLKSCTALTSVKLPSSLATLPGEAFRGCTAITEITLPSTVTKFGGSYAFYGCTKLTKVTGLGNVTAIPYYSFQNCSALESVDFGSEITSIQGYAFSGCKALKSFDLGTKLTTLGGNAFSNSGVTELVFPPTLTSFTATGVFTGLTGVHLYSAIEAPKNAGANSFLISTGNYVPVTVLSGTKSKYESLTGWKSCVISEPQVDNVDAGEPALQFNETSVGVTATIGLNYAETLPERFTDFNTAYFLRNAAKAVVEYASTGGSSEVRSRRVAGETLSVDADLTDGVLTAELPDLAGNTPYTYRVVVTDVDGNEVASEWQNFTTEGTITGIDDVTVAADVIGVTYYSTQGVQSNHPFSGINIVVTKRADGSQTTEKVKF